MEGELFYKMRNSWWEPSDQLFVDNLITRKSYENLEPFQVFSSWAGMAVMSATPFLAPYNVRFRRSDEETEECRASECELISRDFWKVGFGRIQVVPSVQVSLFQF